MTEQRLTPGWYQWMTDNGEQIGKRHYFRVVANDMYRPLCGAKPKDSRCVDNTPPFREDDQCKRCLKLLPLYMPW
ncbi:MAG: hypothetical protein ABIH46_03430 [Chloroflexota bacterium]